LIDHHARLDFVGIWAMITFLPISRKFLALKTRFADNSRATGGNWFHGITSVNTQP
jgi:hypothetical protein